MMVRLTRPTPIPLGHRVELTWYTRPVRGGRWKPDSGDAALIRDLTTGVTYSSREHVADLNAWTTGVVRLRRIEGVVPEDLEGVFAIEPRKDRVVHRRVTGVVTDCVVLQEAEWARTVLTLTVEEDSGAV
ncbi:hypothetical protein [Streptomyces sp. NPDC049879]|uniref:hypothetical protein n=1 Tax=Streptomyces sp. NPDC049879 TaxID=3365598 RepID=UPI0037BB5BD8